MSSVRLNVEINGDFISLTGAWFCLKKIREIRTSTHTKLLIAPICLLLGVSVNNRVEIEELFVLIKAKFCGTEARPFGRTNLVPK